MIHGSRKFCRRGGGGGGGGGVLKLYFSLFTEGSADLTSFSKHFDPRGPTSSRGCQ